MARSPFSTHPYVWALGPVAANLMPSSVVADRYQVVQAQIWQDIHPDQDPDFPKTLPPQYLAYLRLYPQRRHLPEIYGVCAIEDTEVVLLNNAPLTTRGQLLPALADEWPNTSPLRQLYWLWQILELWPHLEAEGVATSLLVPNNIRVEGGRVRLLELLGDRDPITTLSPLIEPWSHLVETAHYSIAADLGNIVAMLQPETPSVKMIRRQLNRLLLEQAAQLPLSVQVSSATDSGADQLQNEDAIYPLPPASPSEPRVLVLCDGIGGHAEGAIASQTAVQTLQLQGQALVNELQYDTTPLEPEIVAEQLIALTAIVNNLLVNRNDQQNRSARQRMATTAVMALQLPQVVETPENRGTSHELYILHIGDSRAYWITAHHCQCLTVDHDIIQREVSHGHAVSRQARHRADAGALTQALGTRSSDRISPTVQRFIIEENGVLLLCSDGLSDRNLLERSWTDVIPEVLRGTMTLDIAVDYLIRLARQHNGHDNVSIVAAQYSVEYPSNTQQFADLKPPTVAPPAIVPPPVRQHPTAPPDSSEIDLTKLGDSNGNYEPEPAPMPTFTKLEEVEQLLSEVQQPEAGASPVTEQPEQPTVIPPTSQGLPMGGDTAADTLPPLPKPQPNPGPPSQTELDDTVVPTSELPEMVPTWDNPNPWAATTPPPLSPTQTSHDSSALPDDLPDLPPSLFDDVSVDEFDVPENADNRPNWLWAVGVIVVVAIVSAIVVVMRSQFSQERITEPERTEQEP